MLLELERNSGKVSRFTLVFVVAQYIIGSVIGSIEWS